MSERRPPVDLGAFARSEPIAPPRRSSLRFIVPGAIVLAFLAILGWNLRGLLRHSTTVTVVRPRPDQPGAASGAGGADIRTPLFQAAGWVEPDPFPVEVPALVAGVVREVLVRESDAIEAGAPVARLVDDAERLEVQSATARVERLVAEQVQADVLAKIASESFDAALAVTEAAAAATALARGAAAEAEQFAAAVVKAEAEVRLADAELSVARHLEQEGAAGPRQVEIARAKLDAANGAIAFARADAARARAAADEAEARRVRAVRELELRLVDRADRDGKRAAAAAKAGELSEAKAALALAQLALDRTTVTAPAAGVVLERRAVPGKSLDPAGDAVVVTLFDPAHVRIRVDVPQAEVRRVSVGQKTEIRAESRADPYHGDVVRVVHRADIQKVTLQVHVRVTDGDALLRPEMLCQVQFLGVPGAGGASTSSAGVWIAQRLVENGAVWVVDALEPVARRRAVSLGLSQGGDVLVTAGLNASDKVIDAGRAGLTDGAAIEVGEGAEGR